METDIGMVIFKMISPTLRTNYKVVVILVRHTCLLVEEKINVLSWIAIFIFMFVLFVTIHLQMYSIVPFSKLYASEQNFHFPKMGLNERHAVTFFILMSFQGHPGSFKVDFVSPFYSLWQKISDYENEFQRDGHI